MILLILFPPHLLISFPPPQVMVRHTAQRAVASLDPAATAFIYWYDTKDLTGWTVLMDQLGRPIYPVTPNRGGHKSLRSADLVVVLPNTGVPMYKLKTKQQPSIPAPIARLRSMCDVLRTVASVSCESEAAEAAAPQHDPILAAQASQLLGSECFICSEIRAFPVAVQCPVCLMAVHKTCTQLLVPSVHRDPPPVPFPKFPSDHLPPGFSEYTCMICRQYILGSAPMASSACVQTPSPPPASQTKRRKL